MAPTVVHGATAGFGICDSATRTACVQSATPEVTVGAVRAIDHEIATGVWLRKLGRNPRTNSRRSSLPLLVGTDANGHEIGEASDVASTQWFGFVTPVRQSPSR